MSPGHLTTECGNDIYPVYVTVRSINCVAYTTWLVLKVINHENIGVEGSVDGMWVFKQKDWYLITVSQSTETKRFI